MASPAPAGIVDRHVQAPPRPTTTRLTRADVMRAPEVAELLGICVGTVYAWAREGKLPARRRGAVVLFLRSEVERWLLDPSRDF